jgi:hypothetical protein
VNKQQKWYKNSIGQKSNEWNIKPLRQIHIKNTTHEPNEGNKTRLQRERDVQKSSSITEDKRELIFWGTTNETDRQYGDSFTDRQVTATHKQQVTRPFLATRNYYNINKKQLAGNVNRGVAIR